MGNRDIVLTVIVLLAIGWLFFSNYHKSSKEEKKPATIEHVQPLVK